jgi:hypothetical protein
VIRRWRSALLFFLFAAAGPAGAYPSYISYGYQSCLACHFNPMGNGPLTDYGRSVAATELSDRMLWSQRLRKDDEKLADLSGFFFGKPPVDWLRPSASYRGLYYETNPGRKDKKGQWINMDASAALVAKFFAQDKLIFVGQISYAPKPLASQGDGKTYESYRSRETYMGYRFTKSFGIYAGLMDKAFGIRVPDHIAFSRMVTRNTENDQTHGILFHYLSEKFEFALQPFAGNLVQENNLRQKGGATQIGWMTGETTRLGASLAVSSSEVLAMTEYSIDVRSGFDKGNSLLLEVGQVASTPKGGTQSTDRYVFLQNQWLLRRGLSTILTAEMFQPDIKVSGETYRFGPGIQYIPIQRVELRADIYDTREHSPSYSDDSWAVTGQLHLWF